MRFRVPKKYLLVRVGAHSIKEGAYSTNSSRLMYEGSLKSSQKNFNVSAIQKLSISSKYDGSVAITSLIAE